MCSSDLFGPMTKDFADNNVSLLAISTDDLAGLKKSIDNYKGGPIPFPLLSNVELDVFKAYRCYDDFEKLPLHGTFLIDAQGKVRWQDISHEPFQDAKFLLAEAKRLLAQSAGSPAPPAAVTAPQTAPTP